MSLRIPVQGLVLAPAQTSQRRCYVPQLPSSLATSSGEPSPVPKGDSPHKGPAGEEPAQQQPQSSSPSISAWPPQTPHGTTEQPYKATTKPSQHHAEATRPKNPRRMPSAIPQEERIPKFWSLPSTVLGQHPRCPVEPAIPCLPAPSPKPQPGKRHFITPSPGFLNA